ncbi:acyl-CoA dehydrogenase family protein [Salsipaludibacter albus]|uniref:acyl-CoA dehydrogenase family protein n=1 Tax=Salsipaludibacter albus TaxID=2849650 RepID=UPI001EE4560C|nr:acyl-CoA dehydrogenase family protein [Salsipaludibacter albus]MBY5163663.1 acyl-CoA dehydrogenase family protein [Salsipaludibacter albus]
MATHTVRNQPPPYEDQDAWADDVTLREAVVRHGADWATDDLQATGRLVGDAEWIERGRLANEHPPVLRTHDRYGHRIDLVEYHPAYHELMAAGVAHGLHAAPWADDRPGAHVARAARYVLWPQVDSGTLCPLTMTYAVVPSLRHQPELAAAWEPLVTSDVYDPTVGPAIGPGTGSGGKQGALFGMAMTEKQGGSDVRANTTAAVPAEPGHDGPGALHRLTGHKWFCSAPMNDAFLVLATLDPQAAPSCFLVPRWLPDGTRNPFAIQRLKDKLGDRSNASGEVEFDDTLGWLVGQPHRGIPVIMEMVAATRLDCIMGATGQMRHGLVQAAWHVAHRSAFGALLAEQPLMRNVVADLALEVAAATTLGLRVAATFDHPDDEHEVALRRLATPIAKYWTCKRAPGHVAEALECLGGNGFVEESGMPRLFRQSPLNGIWEGSGNVQCLDVLRAMARSPGAVDALFVELDAAAGADPHVDRAIATARELVAAPDERSARRVVEHLAVTLQAALLVRNGDPAVADAFCASRLADRHLAYGTLDTAADLDTILARAHPVLR